MGARQPKREKPVSKSRRESRWQNESTRDNLLAAAREAFAESGLEGARVDDIAHRAGTNKQLVYHYFGSKDGLYTEVLERVYADIRTAEANLQLDTFPPELAMRKLVEFEFDFHQSSPEFVRLLMDENTHYGRHLKGLRSLGKLNRPIIDLLRRLLERGVASGVFRDGLDPLQTYLSIAALSFFYFSNIHTLSSAFDAGLSSRQGIANRRKQIVDFVLTSLRAS